MPVGQIIAFGIGSPSTIGLFITPSLLSSTPVTVPDVVGDDEATATAAIEAEGLVVSVVYAYSDTVPIGDVISQNPTAGSEVADGSTVIITVSLGPQPVDQVGYTVVISAGPPTVIAQTTSYALPARAGRLVSTAVLEISADNATWVTLAGSTTGTDVAGGWVRCAGSTATVVIKNY